ncbi:phosphate acetyltransferase [bacterium endosymbiont of Pedicinus badii]|uniref:phosphate acetyltransferase n=1 Tax=bacterium endosymbiont of Pedicinus badii TaxID=1719126 RepID=UPI0009BC6862|nr:phosphate acetyltransferase [bacterium endosymbiont of Pedicinus badii]OQM34459.1 hypothetical protein AOQ89_01040 [bacterium endosymbiont of Pedicinus badii]
MLLKKNNILVIGNKKFRNTIYIVKAIKSILEKKNIFSNIFNPIEEFSYRNTINKLKKKQNFYSVNFINDCFIKGKQDYLIQKIYQKYKENYENSEINFILGISKNKNHYFFQEFNLEILNSFNAKIIFLIFFDKKNIKKIEKEKKILYKYFANSDGSNILGFINILKKNWKDKFLIVSKNQNWKFQKIDKILNIGKIYWEKEYLYFNFTAIKKFFSAKELFYKSKNKNNFFNSIQYYSEIEKCKNLTISNKDLLVINSKKIEKLEKKFFLKIIGKPKAILVTDFKNKESKICKILEKMFLYEKISILFRKKKIKKNQVKFFLSNYLNINNEFFNINKINLSKILRKIKKNTSKNQCISISSTSFIYEILKKSKKLKRTILLPEGENINIIKSAIECVKRKIVNCILMGNPEKIVSIFHKLGFSYKKYGIKIIDPDKKRNEYVEKLLEIRRHKGMNKKEAKEQVKNNIVLANLMLHSGLVDGIVAGIENNTADVVRPALQIIKKKDKYSLVSSIFFMLFKKNVYIYGDCAINPNPSSSQLSEISIQSYETAKKFGLFPKVSVLSYSTGNSAKGDNIEKIKNAIRIAKKNKPDILIEGPVQYDAAVCEEVSIKKFPNSSIKGKTNVFIFPNLDSGNITYKAVQRSTEIKAVGPILQGLNKPVNDISRGATIDDIVLTILITSIQ